jgi:hypothetical protein
MWGGGGGGPGQRRPIGRILSVDRAGGLHCTENLIYVFPEMKLCGLVPNSYILLSVSDLYIPRISRPIFGCS